MINSILCLQTNQMYVTFYQVIYVHVSTNHESYVPCSASTG